MNDEKNTEFYKDSCASHEKYENGSELKTTNMLSIIGIIVAGISLLINFGGIVGICAVILSSVALIQIGKTGEKGKGLAITGIAIGAASIIYAFIIYVSLMI